METMTNMPGSPGGQDIERFRQFATTKETLIGKGPVDHETQKKKIRDWTIALIILVAVGCILWFV